MPRTNLILVAPTALALALAGCGANQTSPPEPEPQTPQVVSPALGIRLDSVPSDFKVTSDRDDTLELAPSDPSIGGTVTFSLGPEGQVNLVAAVKAHQQRIQALPGGDYKGGQELMTPLGSAYYSRGRYLGGNTEMEETVVVVLAPGGDRILSLTYRYPAGVDSSVRVQQALELLGEVEPISSPSATVTPGASG